MELMNDIYSNIDFRYPLTSGAAQYDFNEDNGVLVYRGREPIKMKYPAIKMEFHPKTQIIGGNMNYVYSDYSGHLVFAHGELEPVIITAFTHQQCTGNSGTGYHGKVIADDYIRQIERRVKRYWPSLLSGMEAHLKDNLPYTVYDIANILQGTERQGYELTFYLVSTNKWDYMLGSGAARTFIDASISGADQASYGAGEEYSKIYSISGYMTR